MGRLASDDTTTPGGARPDSGWELVLRAERSARDRVVDGDGTSARTWTWLDRAAEPPPRRRVDLLPLSEAAGRVAARRSDRLGDPLVSLDRLDAADPDAPILVMARCADLARGRLWALRARLEEIGRPWGLLVGRDTRELEWAAVKTELLRGLPPAPHLLVGEAGGPTVVDSRAGEVVEGPPGPGAWERRWDLVAVRGHGDAIDVDLGGAHLCGRASPAEREAWMRVDAAGTPRCWMEERCYRSYSVTAASVEERAESERIEISLLETRLLFLNACAGLLVAPGELYRVEASLGLRALAARVGAVVVSDRARNADPRENRLCSALLRRGWPIGAVVRELNRRQGDLFHGGPGFVLLGDPSLAAPGAAREPNDGAVELAREERPARARPRRHAATRSDGPGDELPERLPEELPDWNWLTILLERLPVLEATATGLDTLLATLARELRAWIDRARGADARIRRVERLPRSLAGLVPLAQEALLDALLARWSESPRGDIVTLAPETYSYLAAASGAEPCPWCGVQATVRDVFLRGGSRVTPREHVFCPCCNLVDDRSVSSGLSLDAREVTRDLPRGRTRLPLVVRNAGRHPIFATVGIALLGSRGRASTDRTSVVLDSGQERRHEFTVEVDDELPGGVYYLKFAGLGHLELRYGLRPVDLATPRGGAPVA